MTLEEQMDELLSRIESGELFAISQGTPQLLKSAIKKSISFNLIIPRGNTYDLTESGYKCIESGGFIKWKEVNESNDKFKSSIINVNAPITSSQLGHGSSFGDVESNSTLNEIPAPATLNDDINIKKLTIWNKIYKWTDHKLVSMIVFGILGFIVSYIFQRIGLLPCK